MIATADRSRVSRGSWSPGLPRTSVIALRTRLTVRQPSSSDRGVARLDQAGLARPLEGGEGLRGAQAGMLGAVPHLEQLDGPLDVGEPAAAELEVGVAVGAAGQPLGVDAGLDPADLDDVVV